MVIHRLVRAWRLHRMGKAHDVLLRHAIALEDRQMIEAVAECNRIFGSLLKREAEAVRRSFRLDALRKQVPKRVVPAKPGEWMSH